MSTELYTFTMLTHFAGYESVHFGVHYAAGDDALPGDGWQARAAFPKDAMK